MKSKAKAIEMINHFKAIFLIYVFFYIQVMGFIENEIVCLFLQVKMIWIPFTFVSVCVCFCDVKLF